MNETPFKFTSEEKEQTLQILERLRTAVGDTFKPGDEQHLREDIQHAFINHQIKRNVFGMNPILAALQTAEIAVNEIGLKRDGIIAIPQALDLLAIDHVRGIDHSECGCNRHLRFPSR